MGFLLGLGKRFGVIVYNFLFAVSQRTVFEGPLNISDYRRESEIGHLSSADKFVSASL